MIRNEENQVLIDHLMEELESYSLQVGAKLEHLDSQKDDYVFFADLLDQLNYSAIDFCSSYHALSEAGKESFEAKLLSLFKDSEIVNHIIQEIINLYYLKDSGLLEQEEVAPQKEIALENLETLSSKISKYLSDTNYDLIIMNHDKISKQMDNLMLFGSILEEDGTPVTDIDFLKDTLEKLVLTPEERTQILLEIIRYNCSIYQEQIEELKEKPSSESNEEEEQMVVVMKGLDELLKELVTE